MTVNPYVSHEVWKSMDKKKEKKNRETQVLRKHINLYAAGYEVIWKYVQKTCQIGQAQPCFVILRTPIQFTYILRTTYMHEWDDNHRCNWSVPTPTEMLWKAGIDEGKTVYVWHCMSCAGRTTITTTTGPPRCCCCSELSPKSKNDQTSERCLPARREDIRPLPLSLPPCDKARTSYQAVVTM